MPASFRISFGMSGTGGAPKNWAMAYSTDGEEYVTPSDGSTAIAIPEAITGSGYFYYFTVTPDAAVAADEGPDAAVETLSNGQCRLQWWYSRI